MKLESKTVEVLNQAEDMMTKMIKEHASDVIGSLAGMDDDTAMMTIGMFRMYESAKDLAVEQARVMDSMEETIKELTRINMQMYERMENKLDKINGKLDSIIEHDEKVEEKDKKAK